MPLIHLTKLDGIIGMLFGLGQTVSDPGQDPQDNGIEHKIIMLDSMRSEDVVITGHSKAEDTGQVE